MIKELVANDLTNVKLCRKEALLLKSFNGHGNIIQIHGFSSAEHSVLFEYMSLNFLSTGVEHASVSSLKFLFVCDDVNDLIGICHC